MDKEEIFVFIPNVTGYFYPNWSGSQVPEAIHSQDDVRQPCLYFIGSEGVFVAPTPGRERARDSFFAGTRAC